MKRIIALPVSSHDDATEVFVEVEVQDGDGAASEPGEISLGILRPARGATAAPVIVTASADAHLTLTLSWSRPDPAASC